VWWELDWSDPAREALRSAARRIAAVAIGRLRGKVVFADMIPTGETPMTNDTMPLG
jgi:hypothetical protein